MLTNNFKERFNQAPFQYLENSELEVLLTHSKKMSFHLGDIILEQGKLCDGMLVIIQGEALVSARILGRKLTNFALLKSGDMIGEASLLDKLPSTTTIVANSELECLLISTVYFDMLAVFFPKIRYKLIKAITEIICARLTHTYKEIMSFIKTPAIASIFNIKKIIEQLVMRKLSEINKSEIDIDNLKKAHIFKRISKNEWDMLIDNVSFVTAPNHTEIINMNDKDISYYFVVRGAVQATIISEDRLVKLSVLGPHCLFGNIYFINHMPSFAAYESCERVILMKMNLDTFTTLQENSFETWCKIYDLISRSFVSLEQSAARLFIRLNAEIYNR